ncbi:YfhO family protein [Candidatus Omnitrophota bacterium]
MLKDKRVVTFFIFLILIGAVYAQVAFFQKTLIPNLYYPKPLAPLGYEGRVPVNTFNIDMGSPAFYEMPINKLVGDMYRRAKAPLWNPYNGIGTPLAAQYSTRTFFPYQIIENISPAYLWDYFMLLRLIIAAFFTYLLLRLLGLSQVPSFLGGILYSLSGSFTWFMNFEQFTNVAMMVPVCLFSCERLIRFKKTRYIAEAALAFACMILAGQPEIAIYVLLLAVCYTIFRIISGKKEDLTNICSEKFKTFLKFVAVAVLGLGLSCLIILSFLEFIPNAYQCHPAGGPMGIQSPARIGFGINLLVPSFFEIPTYHRIFPHNGAWDWMGGYSGILVFLLIFTAFFFKSNRKGVFLFFSIFAFSIILKNFGFPLITWIGRLPLLDQSWSPRWAGPVWTFSLACAGAFALEILSESDQAKRKAVWAVALSMLIILGFLFYKASGMIQFSTLDPNQLRMILPPIVTGLAVATCVVVIFVLLIFICKNKKGLVYGILSLALLELWFYVPKGTAFPWNALRVIPFLVGAVVIFFVSRRTWRLAAAGAFVVIALFTSFDLISPYGFPDRYNIFHEDEYIKFLKNDKLARVVAGEGILMPNFSSAFNIFDPRFINSLSSAEYQNYVENHLMKEPHTWNTDRLWFTGLPDRNKKRPRSIYQEIADGLIYYSYLGVKYIIAPSKFSLNLPLVYDKEVKIYQNPQVLPRAYVAHKIRFASDYQIAQKIMGEKNFDIKGTVILEEKAPAWYKYTNARGQNIKEEFAKIQEYEANKVKISVNTESDSILVLTDLFYPGWKAYVDGRESEIFRVNGLVRGVFLRNGNHEVVFKYSPASFNIGLGISIICLIVCLALFLYRRDERDTSTQKL